MAFGAIIIVLSWQVLSQILDISRNPGSLLGYKLYHYADNEALDSPKIDCNHPSMSGICKLCETLHTQWKGKWSHHYCIILMQILAQIMEISRNNGSLLGY